MSNRDWRVTTKSGSVYHVNLDRGIWKKLNSASLWTTIQSFRSFLRDSVETWEDLRNLPEAEEPVLGESMYLSGTNEWQISTPVVKIEEWVEED